MLKNQIKYITASSSTKKAITHEDKPNEQPESSLPSTSSSSNSQSTHPLQRSTQYTGREKKRKVNDNPENEENGEENQDCPQLQSSKGKEKETPMFACPYYKFDRWKYGKRHHCCGPGWPDVHRVK
ncbi:hypothetical protein BX600DRAFT_432995 [Xylariales sp. PMI_506]|nr:hypothetical protein BX600DRAFT_432995 [Xylariales sp. PMI_506]